MKKFLQWAEELKLDLPVFTDAPKAQKTTDENGKRTGLTANYPDAYVRHQYPHKYFNPIKATADLDLEQQPKKVKDSAL